MTVQDVRGTAVVTRAHRLGLPRYLLAATLARTADAGAAVGLLLLAADRHRDGAAAFTGGLLAAALTAPHLLGPLLARRLDALADGRRMLAAACCAYGVFLAAGAALTGRAPLLLVVAAVALAGTCGPLLTSGLSSQLAGVLRNGPEAERGPRRAEGWDAITYGLAGTAGPAAVAVLAAATTPLAAVLTLATAAGLGGLLTLTLPRRRRRTHDKEAMPTRKVLLLVAGFGPLRRVTYTTMVTALALGGVSVLAVMTGARLSSGAAAGAALVTAFGVGNLGGSLLVTAFPLRGEPERLTTLFVWALAGSLALTAAAPTYVLAMAGFALVGVVNAPFFAATLAARSAYSPATGRARCSPPSPDPRSRPPPPGPPSPACSVRTTRRGSCSAAPPWWERAPPRPPSNDDG